MPLVLQRLLASRKFWVAVFAMVQSIVLYYCKVPDVIWQTIAGLAAVLIAGITTEDSAREFGSATMAARLEVARIQAAAVVSAASVTAKPALATSNLVAAMPGQLDVTPIEKAAKIAAK